MDRIERKIPSGIYMIENNNLDMPCNPWKQQMFCCVMFSCCFITFRTVLLVLGQQNTTKNISRARCATSLQPTCTTPSLDFEVPCVNIKAAFPCIWFPYGDKMVVRPSYLHNGNPYTGKTASFYWDAPLNETSCFLQMTFSNASLDINWRILIQISLRCFSRGPIANNSGLVYVHIPAAC